MATEQKQQSIRQNLRELARAVPGGDRSLTSRLVATRQLSDYLHDKNIRIREVAHLKPAHIAGWVEKMKSAGLSLRTMQGRVSHIRQIMTAAGFDRRAQSEAMSCKALGIAGASRDGTRGAISEAGYQERLAKVEDPGVRSALELQHDLGLRQEEAIEARSDSLARWERQLREGSKVTITDGAKNGRYRECLVLDRERAHQTVKIALQRAQSNRGVLVGKPTLKQAKDRFNNVTRKAGFEDMTSPHTIRYKFAQDSIKRYEAAGLSHREALKLTCRDLGHGDGRGRWVKQVYCRGAIDAVEE